MNKNTPEYYGYKLGENIAPFINICIEKVGECYIGEGTHLIGRNDKNWNVGNVWSDSGIVWGWTRKHDIKIIGAGRNKTILKWIDNCHASYLFDTPRDIMLMITTNYNESCDNNLIEGITFDGNYQNNNSSTLFAIRIRGKNNTIRGCEFINFGVGKKQTHECFQVIVGPINKDEKGATIVDNYFTLPGRKSNSTSDHVAENTIIATGGVDCVINNNVFENMDFNIIDQQSPLHGITIGTSKNAEIKNNKFINFQGSCIYADSWTNENVTIENNIAKNVWQFMHLSCQHWDNTEQISFNKNIKVINNNIELSVGNCYYHWNKPAFVSNFIGYVNAPNVDHLKYPGFENIVIENNTVLLGYRKLNTTYEESTKLLCFWGNSVDENKIKLKNNKFSSTIPISNSSWFKKIINWIKNLFKK